MTDFTNIRYLQSGNARQRAAWWLLHRTQLLEALSAFQPLLAGTIPIEIDLPDSDLDIICCCKEPTKLVEVAVPHLAGYGATPLVSYHSGGVVVVRADLDLFHLEIYSAPTPSHEQNAWRHMLIEYRLLQEKGAEFRAQVLALKAQGIKTEPAFAQLLGLSGDPYLALLQLDA